MNLYNSIVGSMYGQAIGDALGEPVEGMSPIKIKEIYGRVEDYLHTPKITDDTLLTMLVVQSILENNGKVNRLHIAKTILQNKPRIPRIGPTTARSLLELKKDPNYLPKTGTTNGAAMRAPAIGWFFSNLEDVIKNTVESSQVTHGTSEAISGACAIALSVSSAINGESLENIIHYGLIGAKNGKKFGTKTEIDLETVLEKAIFRTKTKSLYDVIEEFGNGLETHSAVSAVFAIISVYEDFKDGVLSAVNFGNDSDTIASMVGAILGARHGINGIPQKWIKEIDENIEFDYRSIAERIVELRK
ncbi:MAG: ADP-ribosylglycohydrolase family protein [Methanosarcinales archaeon]